MNENLMGELAEDTREGNNLEIGNAVRVETALSRFPIHRLAKSGAVEIDLHNQAGAVHWEVTYNSKFGQPGPLAYKLDTLVINRCIDELGRPVPEIIKLGSLREIADQLGHCGGDTNKIKRALRQNSSAYIMAKINYSDASGGKSWIEEDFSRYSLIFTGEQLPNGRKADAVYLRLHPTYRHILNSAITRPLDYDYMKALTPSAQRLYEIASYQIYQAIKNNLMFAKVRYSTFCMLAPAPRYKTFEQVKKQMYKLHKPHLDSGYLLDVKFEAENDSEGEPDWLMLYAPGPNADRWYNEFLPSGSRAIRRTRSATGSDKKPSSVELTLPLPGFEIETPAGTATATAATAEAIDPPETLTLVEQLTGQGMNASDAQRLARTKPDECRRQLDYLPFHDKPRARGAFLRSAIEQGFGAPTAYEEAQELAQAERHRQEVAAERQARRIAQEAQRMAETILVDESLDQLEEDDPEGFRAFSEYIAEQRDNAAKRCVGMNAGMKARILAPFDTGEKRRELFLQWQARQAQRTANFGLRLPADPADVERKHISGSAFRQIGEECEAYNAQRLPEQPERGAQELAGEWLLSIRRAGQKVIDVDKSYLDFCLEKLYRDA